ncbi:hypothetical protein COT30_02250 [Candidatus Micrarchaeota archaeon CG08_land_8_20_14_0_20_49_17]|nr:MAG: hypothetical protein AUJ13_02320 [Candidatus Micrarchaeota archaeon CG1_02_49_24]PIU09858.1 MAG: hypothetical protein COT30_02250 [Candidatus Micrarchaeota archaeon CG08_land_8_20_14_0_20_49_17]PIU81378.1 MAG: hypothetical protein COS70_04420 [Candidatus Micrarchaeota archaeon CG06_land_8_20_14_3_00_50_6]PIZ92373.1 MAG: hypothetical protein COX84_06810 [Candidatus Micrarchaeota archaeon CG_4_10_14_0_2_um_filter_49_7]HII54350.1 HNH endonuclease [Candidatus Micrarchaeota archaeon]
MKMLYPSFAPPARWRSALQGKLLENPAWRQLRRKILDRDDCTCNYCGYRSEKFQIVDHIDGNPENNAENNLQVVCQMCNLIKHAGQGCVIVGIVDLYKKSKFTQNEIIRIARDMRDCGASDERIIMRIGLEETARFRQDLDYLKGLYGFVTSRPSQDRNDMYSKWVEYHKLHNSRTNMDRHQARLMEQNEQEDFTKSPCLMRGF